MKMGSAARRRRARPVIPPPRSACHRGASFADRAMYPCAAPAASGPPGRNCNQNVRCCPSQLRRSVPSSSPIGRFFGRLLAPRGSPPLRAFPHFSPQTRALPRDCACADAPMTSRELARHWRKRSARCALRRRGREPTARPVPNEASVVSF